MDLCDEVIYVSRKPSEEKGNPRRCALKTRPGIKCVSVEFLSAGKFLGVFFSSRRPPEKLFSRPLRGGGEREQILAHSLPPQN